MFGALANKLDKLKIAPGPLMHQVMLDPDIQEVIVNANQEQLYDQGVQADGSPTGDYSEASVVIYGKPPGHIRLFETGYFYESMKVKSDDEQAVIAADTLKEVKDNPYTESPIDLLERWPKAIGLTDESKRKNSPKIKGRFVEKFREAATR